ncbi:hypothetical protein 6991_0070 [Klebsiella phage 6991]|uniref:hypothetical protein n=1 Tax=Klebsiella phage 6991 TaxID=2912296 RepID=UPI00218A7A5A|nr:hypothetical protein PRB93_gp70 [Klebsiella phage 6991]URY99604.1 hypothetical protein 6991_0070 [Klebsiella phage 6991]
MGKKRSYRGLYRPERFLCRDFRKPSNHDALRPVFALKSTFSWGGVFFCELIFYFGRGGTKKVDFRAIFCCFLLINQRLPKVISIVALKSLRL